MARLDVSDSSLALQLRNYRLTTAHILYRLPDHPSLLQELHLAGFGFGRRSFPVLNKFLHFWEK